MNAHIPAEIRTPACARCRKAAPVAGAAWLMLSAVAFGATPVRAAIQAPPAVEGAAPAERPAAGGYRLSAGDAVEIAVVSHPELSKTLTIGPDGKIIYPYLGEVIASGNTPDELGRLLARGLSTEIASPEVTVTLLRRADRIVSVLGAVRSPGKRALLDGWRVLDLLADCGGPSAARNGWVRANLVRGDQTIPVDLAALLDKGDLSQNLSLRPGDVLLVQALDITRTHVQVLGEVAKPGWVPTPEDGSLLAVLTEAGGATPKAALGKVAVVREGERIAVDLTTLDTTGAAAVRLRPGDTLFVPMNRRMYAVFGAVAQPGPFAYPDGEPIHVTRALTLAGGVGAGADLKNARVIRAGAGATGAAGLTDPATAPVTAPPVASAATPPATLVAAAGVDAQFIEIDLEKLLKKGDLSGDVELRPGDIIYVPQQGPGRQGFGLRDALGLLPFVGWFVR